MNLHSNRELFREAVRTTAAKFKIEEIYIEKDYWITLALKLIFCHPIGKHMVFKGGTSLLKCFSLISRFSEDIDLVAVRREVDSDNKLNGRLREVARVVGKELTEISIPNVTQKMGMNRKTAHLYPISFDGAFGHIRPVILIEATFFGDHQPNSRKTVCSFIHQMMYENGMTGTINHYGLEPFEVNVLDPRRTLCEKIMALVRFSNSDHPVDDLKFQIRHLYDLHQILTNKEFRKFFRSDGFHSMLMKVASDDLKGYRNNNKWILRHPRESLIFSDIDFIWSRLQPVYNHEFRKLVFGDLPGQEAVIVTLRGIKSRLENMNWLG